jgi:hypothetical protein
VQKQVLIEISAYPSVAGRSRVNIARLNLQKKTMRQRALHQTSKGNDIIHTAKRGGTNICCPATAQRLQEEVQNIYQACRQTKGCRSVENCPQTECDQLSHGICGAILFQAYSISRLCTSKMQICLHIFSQRRVVEGHGLNNSAMARYFAQPCMSNDLQVMEQGQHLWCLPTERTDKAASKPDTACMEDNRVQTQ